MNDDTLPRLRVRGLAKHFTLHLRGGARLQVLDDASLDVAAGVFTNHCDLRPGNPGTHPTDVATVSGFAGQLGFRVPNMIVSPFSRRHYVGHKAMDHTAVLRFLELRFGLQSLTKRDGRHARLIHDASQTLLGVIGDVLDYSKIEAGAFELSPEPFDPAATVRTAAEIVAEQARAKGAFASAPRNLSMASSIAA